MFTVSDTISDETLSRIIQIESEGKPSAKARTSSATGLGQFISQTWLETVRKHRPDIYKRAKNEVLALRLDPSFSIEMLARFTEDNARGLGKGYTDADLYLAHFSGLGAARKLLRSDQKALASSVYDAAAIKANRSILEGKTVGQVRAWAAKKMANAYVADYVKKFYKGTKKTTVTEKVKDKTKEATETITESVKEHPKKWSLSALLGSLGLLQFGEWISTNPWLAGGIGVSLVIATVALIIYIKRNNVELTVGEGE